MKTIFCLLSLLSFNGFASEIQPCNSLPEHASSFQQKITGMLLKQSQNSLVRELVALNWKMDPKTALDLSQETLPKAICDAYSARASNAAGTGASVGIYKLWLANLGTVVAVWVELPIAEKAPLATLDAFTQDGTFISGGLVVQKTKGPAMEWAKP